MAPEGYIWAQGMPGFVAFIHLVNDQYSYKIYSPWPGQHGPELGPAICEGSGSTLPKGKAAVLEIFDRIEEVNNYGKR